MVGCEERYTPLKKTCWALVWVSKKLRHYMLAYPVRLISRMDPLKKSIKGRAVADFLADYPIEEKVFGIGVLLISPNGSHIPLAFNLNFEVTNNQAEYEACIVCMEAAIEIGIEKLEVVGDSNLVVSQANGDWKVIEEKLKPHHQDLEDLIPHFNKATFTHIPRLKNQFVDALATLASMVEIPIGVKLRPIVIE
ncbi:uncharacterized protein LOC131317435 [Rhododendron vialii]|uniref:uncharacterized protein LOC131317435 n=1 Tax=Rhododendron vialii TaxID=182163 RepID=UPI00265F1ECA|nr:uncharacterized protein LOC131317435 [Rhododendron vialii]